MRIEFNNGVPVECVNWLFENIGQGNVDPVTERVLCTRVDDKWCFRRVEVQDKVNPNKTWRIPTIFIFSDRFDALGAYIALRWA